MFRTLEGDGLKRPTWLVVGLLLVGVGCRPRVPPEVVRTLADVRQVGVFVSPHSYEHFVRGELAAASGDDETAVGHYRQARAGAHDDALIAARMAEALDRLGRTEAADRALSEAAALEQAAEAVHLARAHIEARRGDDQAALAAAIAAVESAPGSETAVLELSVRLQRTGAEPRALEVLRCTHGRAALRARLALAVAAQDPGAAAEAVEAIQRHVPVLEQEAWSAAEVAMTHSQPGLAARLMERLPPAAAPLERLRIRAWIASGRTDEAQAVLQTSDPTRFGDATEASRLLRDAGDPAGAEDIAREATASNPSAWVSVGDAALADGRPVDAVRAYGHVPRGASGAAEARAGMVRALGWLGLPALAAELR